MFLFRELGLHKQLSVQPQTDNCRRMKSNLLKLLKQNNNKKVSHYLLEVLHILANDWR